MKDNNFLKSYQQVFSAIDSCMSLKLIIPSLILIYTGIDCISWLTYEGENISNKKRFKLWVDEWMIVENSLPCNSEELYAARCAILHSLSPNSDLSEKHGVRMISYAWGNADQNQLIESMKLLDYTKSAVLHINDLYSSFRKGFVNYLEALENDTNKKALFKEKSKKLFQDTEISVIQNFLITNSSTKSKN